MPKHKDLVLFEREFRRWAKRFGLSGYRLYFQHKPLDSSFAEITIAQGDMSATVRLNSKLPDKDKPHQDIKLSAKHEALHLLIGRLEQDGRYRWASEGEIYEASEELVHRLENLIT